ncbi:hypothetical protein TTHERM_00756080 (macronuclear) [Tetrahymena thermophila SB210]|uniref:Uncharacterized protein n=1 Tax=Tetrahymena thermophila (strain SB210) TaxID=312017 RepID=I7M625_TETTS|nr:hypothetical protein TTHERM_00756080 [Tetrahymena thermophila SB210]EAR84074.2 hypothetical protein TTHERM_00756080 [Tetrahymena thermophila SB210]|eukprot:XP_001031737.2 hypothetical protein TTHERM_00756080 [Tetrahymena thermophila SB210]
MTDQFKAPLQFICDQILKYNNSSETQIQHVEINKPIQKQKKKRIRRKPLKRCKWLKIEFPFKSSNVFMLTGHIIIETQLADENFWKFLVNKIVKQKEFYMIETTSYENITNFDNLINILQNSQCQYLYEQSQELQKYKQITLNEISTIKQTMKQSNLKTIQKELEQRQIFKDQFIQDYIKNNLKQDDFYVVGSIDPNIESGYSDLKKVFFSKSYLQFVGISETQFESCYFRAFCLFFNIPYLSRRQFFQSILKGYVSNESNQKYILKNLWIQTAEQINLYCNVSIQLIEVPYPENLKSTLNLHKSLDNILITTFNIEHYHLKTILNTRKQDNNKNLDMIDFEYFMQSSIFLDKYYSDIINPFDKEPDDSLDDKSRCSYRLINQ